MEAVAVLGTLAGLGLGSGLSLYATVFVVGWAVRLEWVPLTPMLSGLEVLGHPYVLVVAGVAFFFEFFADKIPFVDSVWDAIHLIVRPLGAAVLGSTLVGSDNGAFQVIAFLLCGGVAFTSHTVKASARVAANHSPEPISNILLSLAEDMLGLLLVWLSLVHPFFVLGVVVIFLAAFVWLFPKIIRLIVRQLRRIREFFGRGVSSRLSVDE